MAEVIRMPKMSDTMEEGTIVSWQKKVGDKVKSGDVLAEVETDKATMELESYEDGTLLHIGIEEGNSAAIDDIIAIIGKDGEDISTLLSEDSSSNGSVKGEEEKNAKKSEESDSSKGKGEKIDTSGINANILTMPKMSDTMTEGTVVSWQKKVGDKVKSGDVLAEVETDKATMELESYEDGELLYVGVEEGNSVKVDGVLAIIGEKGADYETLLKAHEQSAEESAQESDEASKPQVDSDSESKPDKKQESKPASGSANTSAPKSNKGGRIFASPLAKKLASEKGIDISLVEGSGENGRIIKRDIDNYQPKAVEGGAPIPGVVGQESYSEENVSQMRKTIAKRLGESKFSAPHFYLTMEINMDKAIEARKSMNEISPVKISFNDLVIKAVAIALRQHPKVNSSWLGDKIRYNDHIHIGMAVAVEEGLLVPVIRFADAKSVSQISSEAKNLGAKAKNKELQPQDWEGNTFTISNLGMFGIEEFTAIINPPDACILAVGGIKETAIVKEGRLEIGNIMKVTLSCDHRVVDGAVGSAFLQTLKGLLEDPVRILV